VRITERDLNILLRRLNELTGSPTEYFDKESGSINIGHFTLSGAYGGWSLQRVVSDGGGVDDIFQVGHVPKRQLYELIHAYIKGIEFNNNGQ
jgi:hypothetical protein